MSDQRAVCRRVQETGREGRVRPGGERPFCHALPIAAFLACQDWDAIYLSNTPVDWESEKSQAGSDEGSSQPLDFNAPEQHDADVGNPPSSTRSNKIKRVWISAAQAKRSEAKGESAPLPAPEG
eukprot:10689680-Alexandrium_andersonii.AAC.1